MGVLVIQHVLIGAKSRGIIRVPAEISHVSLQWEQSRIEVIPRCMGQLTQKEITCGSWRELILLYYGQWQNLGFLRVLIIMSFQISLVLLFLLKMVDDINSLFFQVN